jgi:hypothetical protein
MIAKKAIHVTIIVILCVILIVVLFAAKSNIALASKNNHTILYVASYIPGPWSQSSNSTTGGIIEGNIVLANPTSNSLNNLNMTIQVDSSETIVPSLRLWNSNYTLNTPNSFFQSVHLFEDMENFSTPITSISIEPNQKETISIVFPSPETFQFSNHSLTIYVSKNNFGDIVNGQLLIVPQTEAYLRIVNFSALESDEGTYHQYYNSTLKSNMVTVAYNPNFYQRYHNISKYDYYADNFGIMHYMGALDYTYFNVTVFNNNTFPVNSVTLFGQIPSRGAYMNDWWALVDYVMQPNETYLFPVAEAELPTYAYATSYLTNTTQPFPSSFSKPIVTAIQEQEFPNQLLIIGLSVLVVAIIASLFLFRRHRKTANLRKQTAY